MEALNKINSICGNEGFLLIGGHAISAYGFRRQTGDIDLLVSKKSRDFWINLIESLGYTSTQKHEVFARFQPLDPGAWPFDLMFVSDEVFSALFAESNEITIGTAHVRIPSVRHMMALKLHALKQRQKHREIKDELDVSKLYELGIVPEDEFRQLCEKYDRIDVYDKFKKIKL